MNPKKFTKRNSKELEVSEPQPDKVTTYSYDFILNKIQELQSELAFFNSLKDEADKFTLTR